MDKKILPFYLVEKGNLPKSVLTDKDNFPMPAEKIAEAVESVVDDYKGIGLILAQPKDALPYLRKAYASAQAEEHKLIYAHILGMLGDATGVELVAAGVIAEQALLRKLDHLDRVLDDFTLAADMRPAFAAADFDEIEVNLRREPPVQA